MTTTDPAKKLIHFEESENKIRLKGIVQLFLIGLNVNIILLLVYFIIFSDSSVMYKYLLVSGGLLILGLSGYLYNKIKFQISLRNEKKLKICNNEVFIISSNRSFLVPFIFICLMIYEVLFFVFFILKYIQEINLLSIIIFILYFILMAISFIVFNNIYSAKLKGPILIITHFYRSKKEIKISEIDEIITLGFHTAKYLAIRFHDNGKEKVVLVLCPTFLSNRRDSYQALLYAHYYYKENIKIY